MPPHLPVYDAAAADAALLNKLQPRQLPELKAIM
jgi:hypothetical protein